MQRVGLHDPASIGDREVSIYAARGEAEPFQVALKAGKHDLTHIKVFMTELQGPDIISRDQITTYREGYVQVPVSSPAWHDGTNPPLGAGWYPDALIPLQDAVTGKKISGGHIHGGPFDVEAGDNQPIWLDVHVPLGIHAGIYRGECRITCDQGADRIPVQLTVWNFDLPKTPSLRSSFGIGRQAEVAQIGEVLLRHGIMPASLGGGNKVQEFLDRFGINAQNTGLWSGVDSAGAARKEQMKPAPSIEEFTGAEQAFPEGFRQNLYNYTADEIGGATYLYGAVKQWARNMHAGSHIKQLIVMPPAHELFDDGTGRPAVDIWAVLPKQSVGATDLANIRAAQAKGCEIWSYNAHVQDGYSPKWEIDFAPINYRILPWINQSYGYTGLLYRQVDNWTEESWTSAGSTKEVPYPGEGQLVYPGGQLGILGAVPSMRLKYIREGIEDYEYIQILKSLGQGDWAMALVKQIGPNWKDWTHDMQALCHARKLMGDRISKLKSGG